MLHKITIGCAVVVAVLAAPVMSAHSMMGGMHSMCTALVVCIVHTWPPDGEATMPRWFHTTTSSASITFITSTTLLTSGTDTYSLPALSAWAVAGGGCQRDGVGTECGFAIEHGPFS